MGGRGAFAGGGNRQMDMSTYLRRQEIAQILRQHDHRTKIISENTSAYGQSGGVTGSQRKWKQCQCCFHYSLPVFSDYEKCPICGWIDDPEQNADWNLTNKSNEMSLKEARYMWQQRNGYDKENE